jgi:hypothetical protein
VRFNAHHHLTEVNLDQAGNAFAGRRNRGDRDTLDRQQHSFSNQLTCPQLTAPPQFHAGVQAGFQCQLAADTFSAHAFSANCSSNASG